MTDPKSTPTGDSFQAVKDVVEIADYLQDQGVEVHHNRARCPMHQGDNPASFAIYPSEKRWQCFGRCNRGGDIIDICQAVEGGEPWEAMITLATRYNAILPEPDEGRLKWLNEKDKRHRVIRRTMIESYQRRYFRTFFTEYLNEMESEVHKQEAPLIWDSLHVVAVYSADKRLSA